MTVAFLSLFFGLITGPYPVELTVDGPAAAVEVLIDGRSAARIPGPPWKATVDFGRDLLPHEIVARALDAQGREVGRAEEWANLPHPLAKVDIVLEREANRPPTAAKVVWKNLTGETTRSVSLSFDGLPVKLDADGRGRLPRHDLSSLHVLTAQVTLKSYKVIRRELAYGGEYGSEVSTELTGVPVRAPAGRLPPAGQLGGWLTENGKPLSVSAIEEGPAQLFVVTGVLPQVLAKKTSKLRNLTGDLLGAGDQLFFVSPAPQRIASSSGRSDLFPITPPLPAAKDDLFRLMRQSGLAELVPGSLRLADAVASAGLAAMNENRRRAVLLVLAGDEDDVSLYDAAAVRRFLAALRVPLFVWYLGNVRPGSTAAAWNAEEITQTWHAAGAAARIRKELDSQRIVMVDGRHLPQAITLAKPEAGVEIAATAAP